MMHLRKLALGMAMSAVALAAFAMPASAGSRWHDRVYSDSFGNLVVESAAGYKRIVVGQGHAAVRMSGYTDADEPNVVTLDELDRRDRHDRERAWRTYGGDCYRAPWLLKGRDYMYGFDQGEIPFQGGPCE